VERSPPHGLQIGRRPAPPTAASGTLGRLMRFLSHYRIAILIPSTFFFLLCFGLAGIYPDPRSSRGPAESRQAAEAPAKKAHEPAPRIFLLFFPT
jgi:hypothetical protein